MSIKVNDFRWEPGTNDAEYIKLLESSRDFWLKMAQKTIARLKALLKAQEPIEPELEEHIEPDFSYWKCGVCGAFLYDAAWFGSTLKDNRPKYCSRCGQAVKWDG